MPGLRNCTCLITQLTPSGPALYIGLCGLAVARFNTWKVSAASPSRSECALRRHTTVQAVTMHMAGCFAFFDDGGHGNIFQRNVLAPYPQDGPEGPIGNDAQPALLSSNADAFHSADATLGPHLARHGQDVHML